MLREPACWALPTCCSNCSLHPSTTTPIQPPQTLSAGCPGCVLCVQGGLRQVMRDLAPNSESVITLRPAELPEGWAPASLAASVALAAAKAGGLRQVAIEVGSSGSGADASAGAAAAAAAVLSGHRTKWHPVPGQLSGYRRDVDEGVMIRVSIPGKSDWRTCADEAKRSKS